MGVAQRYLSYIGCLNARSLNESGDHVTEDVIHNERQLGITGYREMLIGNYRDIPDLHFSVDFLVADGLTVGSRLRFDCRPTETFLGVPVNGRRVIFHENVFYQCHDGKIAAVWTVIDRTEIAHQL